MLAVAAAVTPHGPRNGMSLGICAEDGVWCMGSNLLDGTFSAVFDSLCTRVLRAATCAGEFICDLGQTG